MQELDSTLFDWTTWRNGNIWDVFGIPCRTAALILNGNRLRRFAVGWCRGERLSCRPKTNHIAIMFFKDEKHFWFHLRKHEFETIFPEEANRC